VTGPWRAAFPENSHTIFTHLRRRFFPNEIMLLALTIARGRANSRCMPPSMHDGDTRVDEADMVRGDPWDIVGVERGADEEQIKSAFRRQARTLHPDVSDDPSCVENFRQLVAAFKMVSNMPPDSRETHPLWPYLSELDQYWR
jgi:hypothetical protein